MKVSLVCFTRMGFETMKKIAGTGSAGGNEEKWDTSLWVAGRYALRLAREDAGLPYQAIVEGGLSAWTGAEFQRSDALIFVGACGIPVRAIAPFVQDKFHDPAVLCVDEAGTFVIPILSGHVGGANRLAEFVAGGIGAVPVVTTATDVERKFAVDVFAKDHGLVITDRVLAKRISADILAEEPVGVFSDFGFSGWKKIPLGIGCKRGTPAEKIRETVEDAMRRNGIDLRSVFAVASIDIKKQEQGIIDFANTLQVPFLTFSSEELNSQPGTFTESEFVKKTTGTGNVCERSAVAACRMGVRDCRILFKKEAGDGVTVAAAYDPRL